MAAQAKVLIIDDEPDIRELLEITLRRMDLDVDSAGDVGSARLQLDQSDYDLCFTDMRLPDGNGIDIVKYISQHKPGLPVAVITAYGNMDAAVESLKAGAFDFVSKPVDIKILRNLVNSALRIHQPDKEMITQQAQQKLLGGSHAMMLVRKTISKLARSQAPVYISGESGVGKELAAKMIHEHGPRSEGPFIPVNCGAIPTELMESELFGHKKGSFTGANSDKDGLFQTANGGTLFLDEVADLPMHMQVKLLRVIQEKTVRPIGATRELPIDVRILSATHKNLIDMVSEGEFRQDLYYRINVIELKMPSLRERYEDIPELAGHILRKISREWQIDTPKLGADALKQLNLYAFPGNVRELENILERAVTLCDGETIYDSDLQLEETRQNDADSPELNRGDVPLEQFIDDIEREAIMKALEATRFNKTAAAKKLGITFRALRYRLKKLEID